MLNPNWVAPGSSPKVATPLGLLAGGAVSQGSSCLATLGFEPESRWDSTGEFPKGIRACLKSKIG